MADGRGGLLGFVAGLLVGVGGVLGVQTWIQSSEAAPPAGRAAEATTAPAPETAGLKVVPVDGRGAETMPRVKAHRTAPRPEHDDEDAAATGRTWDGR
jgi:hypothetical protein